MITHGSIISESTYSHVLEEQERLMMERHAIIIRLWGPDCIVDPVARAALTSRFHETTLEHEMLIASVQTRH